MKWVNLLFLFASISCNEKDLDFKLEKSFSTTWNEAYCVTENNCFSLVADTNRLVSTMWYSYENSEKQAVDSMDYADIQYASSLYCFRSQQDNSYVILWKIEHEFYPTFKAFYLKDRTCVKIGDWGAYTPCITCDTQDYAVQDIQIYQRLNRIEFLFLNGVEYVDYSLNSPNNAWMSFSAGELTLSFEID